MPVEQAGYFLVATAFGQSNYCKGAVLNIGLGAGLSARAFLFSRYITRVTSVELLQPTIDAYRVLYPANETLETGRHTIVQGDAATVPSGSLNPPFNFVFIDTISDWSPATINSLKAIATRLKLPGAIAANGVLNVQWHADVLAERQARQWMEDQGWVPEIVRPQLSDTGFGRAASMLVYHP